MFWSTAKAIPSALLPFEQTPISFRKCFFMEKEPRAKNKLGQTRNSRNRSSSRTIKHRKKSECVSLFKRQIHDFPFSSALFTQCVVHFFDDDTFGFAVSACWKKKLRPSMAFKWSMTQLYFAFPHTLAAPSLTKKKDRGANDYRRPKFMREIRNQKWNVQMLFFGSE